MQTRRGSLIESVLNIGSGYILAALTWQFVVPPLVGLPPPSLWENFWITNIFTVVSLARNYLWRRYFNHRIMKAWHTST